MANPEWDQATRDLVMAHANIPRCPVCGRDPELCQDPARADDWDVEDATRCHATTKLREKQATYNEDDNPHMDALFWRVGLVPRGGP